MEITCNTIRDILPLYAEDMVTRDTKKLVEGHLAHCKSCNAELDAICAAQGIPVEVNSEPLKQVERTIHRRIFLTAAAAVLMVTTILSGIFIYLTVPVWLPAEEAIEYVESLEDGRLKIQYDPRVDGKIINQRGGNVGYLCYMYRYRQIFFRNLPDGMNEASYGGYDIVGPEYENGSISAWPVENSYWYLDCNDFTAQTLLWDAGLARPEEPMLYGTWILGWLCIGAAGLAVVSGALFAVLRRLRWRGVIGRIAMICCCWAAASGLVTSFRFMMNFDFLLKLVYIMMMTGLMFGTWMCMIKLCEKPGRN